MSETTPDQPQIPYLLVNAEAYVRPADLNRFTEDQRKAIETGPGWITEPAQMQEYCTIEDFKHAADNFKPYFIPTHTIGEWLRNVTRSYQRFAILHPDTVAYLNETLQEPKIGEAIPDADIELLRKAYLIMSKLVDANDEYIKDKHGNIDPKALA